MSISINQRLYPPLVNTFAPSFIAGDSCRIYFSKTNYNNDDDIAHVQLAFTDVNNNATVLDTQDFWPNEIKLCPIQEATPEEIKQHGLAADYRFYVEVSPLELQLGQFDIGQFYKAQLRFSEVNPPGFPADPGAAWFIDNMDKFSEWSRVSLVKCTAAPLINLYGLRESGTTMVGMFDYLGLSLQDLFGEDFEVDDFDNLIVPPGTPLTVDYFDNGGVIDLLLGPNHFVGSDEGYGLWTFVGQYANEDSTEPLKSYRAKLYQGDYDALLAEFPLGEEYENLNIEIFENSSIFGTDFSLVSDLGEQYPDTLYSYTTYTGTSANPWPAVRNGVFNGFHFRFKSILENGTEYVMFLEHTTKTGLKVTGIYNFLTAFSYGQDLGIQPITLQLEGDKGRIGVPVYTTEDVSGESLLILRSDSTTNFTIWEEVYSEKFNDTPQTLNKIFYDYNIESGVLYKYRVNNVVSNIGLLAYDDIFLNGNNKQLKIQFNPTISSFRRTVLDSKTETLGGKYPYVRRNGDVNYQEFPLSGLITIHMDEDFYELPAHYQEHNEVYEDYNVQNQINAYYDRIKEKEFRQQVLDFLYDGKIKLFKSTTEGNILIKLTDISLTPNNALGRMIYTFQANATEVDEYNLINCKKYQSQLGDLYEFIDVDS